MLWCMRTALTLDDDVAQLLERVRKRRGGSLTQLVNEALSAGIARLEALEIDADTEFELSTDGDVLVVTPVRNRNRKKRTAELVAEAHELYGGVFRRLAE